MQPTPHKQPDPKPQRGRGPACIRSPLPANKHERTTGSSSSRSSSNNNNSSDNGKRNDKADNNNNNNNNKQQQQQRQQLHPSTLMHSTTIGPSAGRSMALLNAGGDPQKCRFDRNRQLHLVPFTYGLFYQPTSIERTTMMTLCTEHI